MADVLSLFAEDIKPKPKMAGAWPPPVLSTAPAVSHFPQYLPFLQSLGSSH